MATYATDQSIALRSTSIGSGSGISNNGWIKINLKSNTKSWRRTLRYTGCSPVAKAVTTQSTDPAKPTKTILREIPGSYGLPLLGSISDRLNFFWFKGAEELFRSRIQQYQSTVFRFNMPPGPPFFPDPRVIVLLDQKSFPVLFDTAKVSKRDVFTGTYRPSVEFNGGYRILAYLDVDELRHEQIKGFCLDMLKSKAKSFVPEIGFTAGRCFDGWERDLEAKKEAELVSSIEDSTLPFLTRALLDHDAAGSELTVPIIKKWLLPQIAPVAALHEIPPLLMELLHIFPLPFSLFKKDYNTIVSFFATHGTALLDMAVTRGVPRDEALHNLIFIVCFNTFGGLSRLLPTLLKRVHDLGLAKELSDEVAVAVRTAGGRLTARSLDGMPLLQSVVYEQMRFEPPVSFQYGHARQDLVIESHKEAFRVKKGEMLCGFQPITTRDPAVFDRADEFLPRRFTGSDGEKLLKFVLWSNGPETEDPTVENKQCARKNFIVFVTRLFLAEFLSRYESFQLQGNKIASLKRKCS